MSGHTHISITICRQAVVCSGLVAADDDRGWPGDSAHVKLGRSQYIHKHTLGETDGHTLWDLGSNNSFHTFRAKWPKLKDIQAKTEKFFECYKFFMHFLGFCHP